MPFVSHAYSTLVTKDALPAGRGVHSPRYDVEWHTSIASRVARSPQKYSQAFVSQAPRLVPTPPCHPGTYDATKPFNIGVRDPHRASSVFCSALDRFPTTLVSGRHPGFQQPQPRFSTPDKNPHLELDRAHWTRLGFCTAVSPRAATPRASLTQDLEPPDYSRAGEHVDAMKLPMGQSVCTSPWKFRNMSSKSPRFVLPKAPYETGLGPGSFDAWKSSFAIDSPV
jgi:hypothetical protein